MIIYVVVRRARDDGGDIVGWSFDEGQAKAEAIRLNNGDQWGPHVVEEVPPLGNST